MDPRTVLAVAVLFGMAATGATAADHLIPTAGLDTALGPTAALAYVHESPSHGWFDLTPGLVLDGAVGLAGVKACVGAGYGGRDREEKGIVALKATLLQRWSTVRLRAARSTYVGAEAEVVLNYGVVVGALKRVDGPGWQFTAALVRAF